MENKKYALVEVFGLIVQDVVMFDTEKEAESYFKQFTGMSFNEAYPEDGEPNEEFHDGKYDQTKIFAI